LRHRSIRGDRPVARSSGAAMETRMATRKRTTLYSSAGKKLYAVRNADGTFKDIQTYARAHRADMAHKSAAEKATAAKKAAKKPAAKKVAKKAAAKKAAVKKAPAKKAAKKVAKKAVKKSPAKKAAKKK